MIKYGFLILLCAAFGTATISRLSELGRESLGGAAPPASVSLKPCEVSAAGAGREQALCGTWDVFEDRQRRTGRKIALRSSCFRPPGGQSGANGTKAADPLFYIPGGPGSSATEDAPYVAGEFAKIREHRDLVFVDQRGTGGSNPLNCDFFTSELRRAYLHVPRRLFPARRRAQMPRPIRIQSQPQTLHHPDCDGRSGRRARGAGLQANQYYRRIIWHARRAGLSQASSTGFARLSCMVCHRPTS